MAGLELSQLLGAAFGKGENLAGEGELPGWVRAHSIQRAPPNFSPSPNGKEPPKPFLNPNTQSYHCHLPCIQ